MLGASRVAVAAVLVKADERNGNQGREEDGAPPAAEPLVEQSPNALKRVHRQLRNNREGKKFVGLTTPF